MAAFGVDITTTRRSAMGGPHAALADDRDALFVNPAGYVSAPPELTVTEFNMHLTGPVFTIANVFLANSDTGSGPLPPGAVDALTGLYASVSLVGPLSFSYVGNGLGVGLFNDTQMVMETSSDVEASLAESTILVGGYAFRLPLESDIHTVDVGFSLKGYVSGAVAISTPLLDITSVINSFGEDFLLQQPFTITTGIGSDFGVLYSYDRFFKMGISAMDLLTYTVTNSYSSLDGFIQDASLNETGSVSEQLPQKLNAGVLFRPPFVLDNKIITDWTMMLDYSDILDFLLVPERSVNPILHFGIGTELTLLEILALRGGFYQGLLNAGMGLDLQIFQLNFSVFGRELSTEPGLKPVYNIQIGLEFSY